jgi:hypothetical protein
MKNILELILNMYLLTSDTDWGTWGAPTGKQDEREEAHVEGTAPD